MSGEHKVARLGRVMVDGVGAHAERETQSSKLIVERTDCVMLRLGESSGIVVLSRLMDESEFIRGALDWPTPPLKPAFRKRIRGRDRWPSTGSYDFQGRNREGYER